MLIVSSRWDFTIISNPAIWCDRRLNPATKTIIIENNESSLVNKNKSYTPKLALHWYLLVIVGQVIYCNKVMFWEHAHMVAGLACHLC